MTIDILMLAIYLLLHFLVISTAVLVALWLFYITEWVMDKLANNPLDEEHPFGHAFHERHD